jgi:hypothetical protein
MAIPSHIIEHLKDTVQKSQEVLVLLPQNAGQEMVTGALGLYLVLAGAGKNVTVACPTKISDSSRALPSGDQIAQKIGNRNLVISLKVTDRDSIDKVSYNLDEATKTFNLIIQPKKGNPAFKKDEVSYSYSGAAADLIITVGANRLEDLGLFYEEERQLFADAKTISLHRFPTPTFADYQILDSQVSGFGELAYELTQELGLALTPDAATNFLAGIDLSTNNLQNSNLKPDSLEHMAQLLRAGGLRATSQVKTGPVASVTLAKPQPAVAAPSTTVPQEWLTPKIYKSTPKTTN